MGNKVSSILPKTLRRHKKPKKIESKVLICKDIVNLNDDEDVFFTPKSSSGEADGDESNFKIPTQEVFLQSDDSPTYVCDICVEQRALIDSFNLKNCTHFYCTKCTVSYVNSKLDDNLTRISCPVLDCEGVLEPDYCREILPKDVFDRWGIALCDSVIDNSQKFYCPYKDCSALLIDDTGRDVKYSDCPFCKRAFCVKCKVPWHSEISCQKFQKLKKEGDDSLLIDLAKRNDWRRCPKCKFYVEKSTGCFYIMCRCGYAFCYKCGARSSTTSHVCPNPRCKG